MNLELFSFKWNTSINQSDVFDKIYFLLQKNLLTKEYLQNMFQEIDSHIFSFINFWKSNEIDLFTELINIILIQRFSLQSDIETILHKREQKVISKKIKNEYQNIKQSLKEISNNLKLKRLNNIIKNLCISLNLMNHISWINILTYTSKLFHYKTQLTHQIYINVYYHLVIINKNCYKVELIKYIPSFHETLTLNQNLIFDNYSKYDQLAILYCLNFMFSSLVYGPLSPKVLSQITNVTHIRSHIFQVN